MFCAPTYAFIVTWSCSSESTLSYALEARAGQERGHAGGQSQSSPPRHPTWQGASRYSLEVLPHSQVGSHLPWLHLPGWGGGSRSLAHPTRDHDCGSRWSLCVCGSCVPKTPSLSAPTWSPLWPPLWLAFVVAGFDRCLEKTVNLHRSHCQ